jgi:hypothetical protein
LAPKGLFVSTATEPKGLLVIVHTTLRILAGGIFRFISASKYTGWPIGTVDSPLAISAVASVPVLSAGVSGRTSIRPVRFVVELAALTDVRAPPANNTTAVNKACAF